MSVLSRASRAAGLLWLRQIVAAGWLVAVVAAPLFLVTTNVLWAFGAPRLYTYGFQKYDIAQEMLMPSEELERVAAELRAYWHNDAEFISVTYAGRPFFNQREAVHLRDVKILVGSVGTARWVTLGLVLGWLALAAFRWRSLATKEFAQLAIWGGGLTLALVAFCGLIFLFAFDWAFLLFHRLSFANDFWQLACPGDNLVCLFPQGFWFDAAMFIVLATVVEAAVLLAGGLALFRLLGKTQSEQAIALPPRR